MSDVAKRFGGPRRLAMAAGGLAAALGLALPAAAVQAATTGYTPPPAEWWTSAWAAPQQVWPLTEGSGVTVGVVDSGVQADYPDLSGVVLRGADMLGNSGHGDRDFAPAPGHGTYVAEMIAGQGINGGPVGLAPQAKILPVHVLYPGTSSPAIPQGIKYAAVHGASVINLSVGTAVTTATYCDPATQAAVAFALAHNVVVVAGSGDINKGGPGPIEPASCAGVLSVGGTEPNDSLWKDSVRQPYVSVAAPGDHMLVGGAGGQTGTGNGTSLSSPLVAAAAALIRSKYPTMPWYQVDQRIIDTAVGVKPVPNDGYGYGIMDVARAVDVAKFPVPASGPNPPYARYLAWLKSPYGQDWAKANGVTVPSSGKSGSGGAGSGAAPSATAKAASGGTATLIIAVVVIVVLLAVLVLALVLRSRSRSRRY